MFDEEVIIKEEKSPIKINIIRRLSNLFYQNSSLLIAIALAIIFTGYLFLVMMSKSTGFELSDGNIKSLGTYFRNKYLYYLIFCSTY